MACLVSVVIPVRMLEILLEHSIVLQNWKFVLCIVGLTSGIWFLLRKWITKNPMDNQLDEDATSDEAEDEIGKINVNVVKMYLLFIHML